MQVQTMEIGPAPAEAGVDGAPVAGEPLDAIAGTEVLPDQTQVNQVAEFVTGRAMTALPEFTGETALSKQVTLGGNPETTDGDWYSPN